MNTFLLIVLVMSLLIITLITIFGWKTKTNENLILFQSLPLTFIYSLLFVAIPLQRYLFPGQDTEGYGIGFAVLLPTGLFVFFSMLILGIKGLTQWKAENDKLLLVTSIASASVMITVVFTHFLFPLVTLYILLVKAVRKWKSKPKPIT